MRRALAVAGCGVLTVGATACESTEQESSKLAREDKQAVVGPTSLKLGAVNHSVRVADVTLLRDAGRTAVAVRLTGTSAAPQLRVPVLVSVTGSDGKQLYSNTAGGLEPSLQRIGVLLPRHPEWWVDDQVLTSTTPTAAQVRVGSGTSSKDGAIPTLATSGVALSSSSGSAVLNGGVVSHSSKTLDGIAVFAVYLRAGKVVAAGRALIEQLPGGSTAPVPFEIFLVGNPSGATLELTVVPTAA